MSGPKWYHIVLMIGGAVALGTLGGKIVAEKAAENQREWERFEASHGGCWRTGAYDVSTSLVPIYGPDASDNLTIITWTTQDDYTYHWICRDGVTYKR